MANRAAAFGLAPASHLQGSTFVGQVRTYHIPSTDGNAYAIGDPVISNGTGDSKGVPGAVLATAGGSNMVMGCIVGMGGAAYGGAIGVDPVSQDRIIVPASKTKDYYIVVADDPYTIFTIIEDPTQAALAAADIGLNISLKAGTNNGFLSGWVLDQSTKATTSTLQMRLLGLVQRADNAFGTGAEWLVMINNHFYKPGQTGIA